MLITSLENERVKKYIKLKTKKYRDKYNEFIIEGMHQVMEAKKCGIIKEIILEKDEVLSINDEIIYLPYEIMKKISTNDNPPKVMALCKKIDKNELIGDKILILDGIQDPGNLGTILRSAKAFNIDSVIMSEDTVDLYNPKVLRATQGIVFHLNIVSGDIKKQIKQIKEKNIPIYTTNVEKGNNVKKLLKKDKQKYALIVGNEGNGVKKEIEELADTKLCIKMNASVESLNVAVATSILLYELGDIDE